MSRQKDNVQKVKRQVSIEVKFDTIWLTPCQEGLDYSVVPYQDTHKIIMHFKRVSYNDKQHLGKFFKEKIEPWLEELRRKNGWPMHASGSNTPHIKYNWDVEIYPIDYASHAMHTCDKLINMLKKEFGTTAPRLLLP